MNNTDEGATPAAPEPSGECIADGRVRAHSWKWKWEDGTWTNFVRCSTCGSEREQER